VAWAESDGEVTHCPSGLPIAFGQIRTPSVAAFSITALASEVKRASSTNRHSITVSNSRESSATFARSPDQGEPGF
jgi:hypothetical protein